VLSQLASNPKVVGVKQSTKAVQSGKAKTVFFACNADPEVLIKLKVLCEQKGVETNDEFSMHALGEAAKISVGAAVVAVLKEE